MLDFFKNPINLGEGKPVGLCMEQYCIRQGWFTFNGAKIKPFWSSGQTTDWTNLTIHDTHTV